MCTALNLEKFSARLKKSQEKSPKKEKLLDFLEQTRDEALETSAWIVANFFESCEMGTQFEERSWMAL